jgi:asparagine synthase (glutamine-hydrolysing)
MDAAEKRQLYDSSLSARVNGDQGADWLLGVFQQARQRDQLAQQQYVDIKTYLADNILAKVDRMSMAASIEARVPLLDHRLVEFVLNLPPQLKLHRGQTKVILRQTMRDRLPPAVLDKPKQGFSIPIKNWLRGPLREMMGDLLSPDTVRRRGYFQANTINNWMSEHLNGKANHSHRLWALMVFEAWMQNEDNR